MDNYIKKGLAVLFVLFLLTGFFINKAYLQIPLLSKYITETEMFKIQDSSAINDIESDFVADIKYMDRFIDLNGEIAKNMGIQDLCSTAGIYVTDDLYIMSPSPWTSTDYEYDQIMDFKQFLDENGIQLLYVNKPTKYVDDSIFIKEFSIQTYSNQNADRFLERIKSEGVSVIDLRDDIREENLNVADMFFRTDHHWTTRTALWGAQKVAEGLNTYCGYDIDLSLYDEDNYTFTEWTDCWLGEQGRKASAAYVGLDDYTEIKPKFETSYTFSTDQGDVYGDFNGFIDETLYDFDNNPYHNISWNYSYKKVDCTNHNADYGKVLLLGDSYDRNMEPLLSLGIHEIDNLEPRGLGPSFDLRQFILNNDYDTVIIAYAQFMIGAHDDPTSANYRMFDFH